MSDDLDRATRERKGMDRLAALVVDDPADEFKREYKEIREVEKLAIALEAAERRELHLSNRLREARDEIDRLRTTVDCDACGGTGRVPKDEPSDG